MPIRPLPKELIEKARIELNEDPDRVKDDIKYIKDWLKKQPHIKARTDDQWILAFLRGCKFSLERTKEKIDFFYTCRSMLPEFFADRDPLKPEIQEILKLGIFIPIVKQAPHEQGLVLLRNGAFDPNKIKILDIFKANMLAMDIGLLEDDYGLINGMHVIQDMGDLTVNHLFSPAIVKKVTTLYQQAYPNRPKGVHSFNVPPFFEMVLGLFRPLLTQKMNNRIKVYSNAKELFEKNPEFKERLPKEYGGEGAPMAELIEEYKKKIEGYREWFLEDAKYGVDESKRPGKPKSVDELFGVEGSFRKLNID